MLSAVSPLALRRWPVARELRRANPAVSVGVDGFEHLAVLSAGNLVLLELVKRNLAVPIEIQ